jgi:hypothetical protein
VLLDYERTSSDVGCGGRGRRPEGFRSPLRVALGAISLEAVGHALAFYLYRI